MKKLLLLCCMFLVAGVAGAQCVAGLSAVQNPQGNNLLNVSFTNSSTYGFPFSGQMKDFNITFGDGTFLNNYQGTSVPDHNYPTPGIYAIGFRMRSYDSATNSTVCTDSTTAYIGVNYPACGTLISVSGTGTTKTFTATNPALTTGITYSWNYGDGNFGTGSPVSH